MKLRLYLHAVRIGFATGLMDIAVLFCSRPWRWRDEWQENQRWKRRQLDALAPLIRKIVDLEMAKREQP